MALWHLQQNPTLSHAFANRFAYVFVDEAQDTNTEQFKILDAAFSDRKRSIVQFLGDPNQAIYNFKVTKNADWSPTASPMQFSDTMRYGSTIAAILDKVRIDDQISLLPNLDRLSLQPHLLTFSEGEEDLVLPSFARLLKDTGLDGKDDGSPPIFKAVGWVGKDNREDGKLCIPSYFPEYERRTVRSRQYFNNMISYVQPQRCNAAVNFRNAVLSGICRALTIGEINHPATDRPFTATTFTPWLHDANEAAYDELLSLLSEWCLQSKRHDYCPDSIRKQIIAYLLKNWDEINTSASFDKFISDTKAEVEKPEHTTDNTFCDGKVTIEVGTVHSVKGETHKATLYLETSYMKKVDSQRLLPFIKGEYPKQLVCKAEHIQNLKLAHVAMSRPTHLLTFACCEQSISGHEESLAATGWKIISCESNLPEE